MTGRPVDGHSRVLAAVADWYGLGAVESWSVVPPGGTANLVHRVTTGAGVFAIKHFRYTASDRRWFATLVRGAEFEQAARRSGELFMPEPVPDRHGDLIALVPGPREHVAVRVHRWLDGQRMPDRPDRQDAAAAGAAQFRIQRIGAGFGRARSAALLWWRWDPQAVLADLLATGQIDPAGREAGADTIADALDLVRAAEVSAGTWVYCHYDVKPKNFLRTPHGLAVLDWDESFLCRPRQETVEAALMWGGYETGDAEAAGFTAFIDGYRRAGGRLDRIDRLDFGKFIASALGWFDYVGRCRLAEFTAVAAVEDRPDPGEVLSDLRRRLDHIDTWQAWI